MVEGPRLKAVCRGQIQNLFGPEQTAYPLLDSVDLLFGQVEVGRNAPIGRRRRVFGQLSFCE